MIFGRLFTFLLVTLCLSSPAMALNYSVERIAAITPGNSWRWDINESGQVVGWDFDEYANSRAFVYTPGSGVNYIGTLGGNLSTAMSINDDGVAVGAARTSTGMQTPFKWTSSSGMTAVMPSYNGGAYYINNDGDHVGWVWVPGVGQRGYVSINNSVSTVGTFGGDLSSTLSINSSQTVVGLALNSDGYKRAYISSGNYSTLTPLGTLGGNESTAWIINDNNQVVGWSNNSDGYQRAFLWENGVMEELETLNGGVSHAASINNDGTAVGYAETAPGNYSATVWVDGEIYDLNSFLPDGVDWHLGTGHAVNEQGQLVVTGSSEGEKYFFVLTPTADPVVPEPATLLLLIAGMVGLVRRVR